MAENKGRANTNSSPGLGDAKGLPRDFLQPWLLLLLKSWNAHGYALLRALTELGFTQIDHSALYRELRALEQKGFLYSFWDTSHNGPARRTYSLTEAGEQFLKTWVANMEHYQRMLSGFFQAYAKAWDEYRSEGRASGEKTGRTRKTAKTRISTLGGKQNAYRNNR